MPQASTNTINNAGPQRLALESGATFAAERIAGAQSAALSLLIPSGTAHDPENRLGMSAMWSTNTAPRRRRSWTTCGLCTIS